MALPDNKMTQVSNRLLGKRTMAASHLHLSVFVQHLAMDLGHYGGPRGQCLPPRVGVVWTDPGGTGKE